MVPSLIIDPLRILKGRNDRDASWCTRNPSLIIDPLRILKDDVPDADAAMFARPSLIIDPLRILKDTVMPRSGCQYAIAFIDYRSVEDTESQMPYVI